jgi:maltose alpha-D-glucosyltransferase/alpha-amylase
MGVTPVECMGGVVFPRIGELSYLLTLPGHGFYWFQLPAARDDRSAENRPAVSGAAQSATVERLPGPPESHQQ